MNSFTTFLLSSALLAFPAGALAANDNQSVSAIRVQQEQIRSELSAGKGRFKSLDATRQAELARHQEVVLARLSGVDQVSELSAPDQLAVSDALAAIDAIIETIKDERMVCERVKALGSNRPVKVCKTVAQRRAEQLGGDQAQALSREN